MNTQGLYSHASIRMNQIMNRMNENIKNHITIVVVAMSSSQCVNRGRACIVVNRDNYSEYYMCVHVRQVTVVVVDPLLPDYWGESASVVASQFNELVLSNLGSCTI